MASTCGNVSSSVAWLRSGGATYLKIASSNASCLEAHVGFLRLLMKGIFGPLCNVTF